MAVTNIPELKYRLRHYAMASVENYEKIHEIVIGEGCSITQKQLEYDPFTLKFYINSLNDKEAINIYKMIFGES